MPPEQTSGQDEKYRRAIWALVVVGIVVRFAALGRTPLDFDETFAATAARLPFDQLVDFLRTDHHPPFDYLLRAPMARAGASDWLVRLPSVVFSSGALIVLAWWMKDRGRLGLLTVGIACLLDFSITYATEARMYAAAMLAGVVVAYTSDAWSRSNSLRYTAWGSVALLFGLANLATFWFVVPAMLLVPGKRRDPEAWKWRGAVVGTAALWVLIWGTVLIDQVRAGSGGWIPDATPSYVVRVLGELVAGAPSISWLIVTALIGGGVVLARRDSQLARTFVLAGLVPVALLIAVSIFRSMLLPRSVAFVWWVPPIALAALVDAAFARWRPSGVVALILAGIVVIAPTVVSLRESEPQTQAVQAVVASAKDGDAVATNPYWLAPLLKWHVGARGDLGSTPITPQHSIDADDKAINGPSVGLSDSAYALQVGTGSPTGKVWLLVPDVYEESAPGLKPCGPDRVFANYIVRCLQR